MKPTHAQVLCVGIHTLLIWSSAMRFTLHAMARRCGAIVIIIGIGLSTAAPACVSDDADVAHAGGVRGAISEPT